MSNTINVKTYFNSDLISQVVEQEFFGRKEEMYQQIIKLQDKGVREALIEMGWTPPEQQAKEQYNKICGGSDESSS